MSATPPRVTDPPSEGRTLRRRPWWTLVGVFVVGVVVGVVLVGVLSAGTPDFVTSNSQAQTSGEPTPSGGVEVAARAEVNAACLRVINEAQDVYSVLTGLDTAVGDVDFQALDDIVRRLQPIQPRLAEDLQDCRVTAAPGEDPVGTPSAGESPGSAAPTPTPVVPTPSAVVPSPSVSVGG